MFLLHPEELTSFKRRLINLLLTVLVFISGGFYFTGINSFVSKFIEAPETSRQMASVDNIIVKK